MIEWFGGNWDEVPFEYHRNSAVYFADSTHSMHYNLQYTPLYLDFGMTETHRTHAEDLYNLIYGYNENMWIDTNPSGSHGYSVLDENHVCDWLEQFELIDNPNNIKVNLDEPSRAYWIEAKNQIDSLNFIYANISRNEDQILIEEYTNSDSLILHIINNNFEDINLVIEDASINTLGVTGLAMENINDGIFTIDISGAPSDYFFEDDILWIQCIPSYPQQDCLLEQYQNYNLNIQIDNMYNDINQDGVWNVIDIILVMNHIIDTALLNDFQLINADLNNDTIINVLDIIEIVNLILNN
tara:strand:- start:7 stop:900 length:894 start_codon:yes stop_codon:yes gene_type:complete